jgi:hypothetical protein
MTIKVYVNESNDDRTNCGLALPKVLTEKEYDALVEECIQERLKKENLMEDDGFADWLGCDYTLSKVFFLSEEERKNILRDFDFYARDDVYDELKGYYEEYEIEI